MWIGFRVGYIPRHLISHFNLLAISKGTGEENNPKKLM